MTGPKYWNNLIEQEADKLTYPITDEAKNALFRYAGKPGCYGFRMLGKWVYIGRTSRLPARVLKSAKDRVDGDPVTLALMPTLTEANSWHQEIALIHKHRPTLNKASLASDSTTFSIPLPEVVCEVPLFDIK